MPGIAAIANNAVPDAKTIHCFYITSESNLGLELKNGQREGKDPDVKIVASAAGHRGIIVDSSQLGATDYRGINLVVGFTQPAGDSAHHESTHSESPQNTTTRDALHNAIQDAISYNSVYDGTNYDDSSTDDTTTDGTTHDGTTHDGTHDSSSPDNAIYDGNTHDVSILSPSYMPLAQTEKSHNTIAVCSHGDQAWVYYLG
jgi:hypothetical protein